MEKHEIGVNASPLKLKEVMKTYFILQYWFLITKVGDQNYYQKWSNDVWTNHQDQERETKSKWTFLFFFFFVIFWS